MKKKALPITKMSTVHALTKVTAHLFITKPMARKDKTTSEREMTAQEWCATNGIKYPVLHPSPTTLFFLHPLLSFHTLSLSPTCSSSGETY